MRIVLSMLSVLFLVVSSNSQSDPKETLIVLNNQLRADVHRKDINNAIKVAARILSLTEKVFGQTSVDAGIAHENLGILYQSKNDLSSAISSLERALVIFSVNEAENADRIFSVLQRVARAEHLRNRTAAHSSRYLRALEFGERHFGPESSKLLDVLLRYATALGEERRLEESDEAFIRAYRLATRHFETESNEVQSVHDAVFCSSASASESRERRRYDGFRETVANKDRSEREYEGIINGRALSLVRPKFPYSKGHGTVGGEAVVRILVDEDGKIAEATLVCQATKELGEASVKAARASRFSPTIRNGVPVKVSGYIVYRFVF